MGKVKNKGNTTINIINVGNNNRLNGANGLQGLNGAGRGNNPRSLVGRLKQALARALGGQGGCCNSGGCCGMGNPGFGGGGCCNNSFAGAGLQFGMNVRGFLG